MLLAIAEGSWELLLQLLLKTHIGWIDGTPLTVVGLHTHGVDGELILAMSHRNCCLRVLRLWSEIGTEAWGGLSPHSRLNLGHIDVTIV